MGGRCRLHVRCRLGYGKQRLGRRSGGWRSKGSLCRHIIMGPPNLRHTMSLSMQRQAEDNEQDCIYVVIGLFHVEG